MVLVLMDHNNKSMQGIYFAIKVSEDTCKLFFFLVLYKMSQKATRFTPVGLVSVSMCTDDAYLWSLQTTCGHNQDSLPYSPGQYNRPFSLWAGLNFFAGRLHCGSAHETTKTHSKRDLHLTE